MSLRPIGLTSDIKQVTMVANDNFRVIDNQFRTNVIKTGDGGSLVFGQQSDDTYGTSFYDSAGNLQRRTTAETDFYYDTSDGRNYMQIGKLPDGSYGVAIAESPNDVGDAIT